MAYIAALLLWGLLPTWGAAVLTLAQAGPSGLDDIIATYGPFAPFAGLLLWLLRTLWQENQKKDAEIQRLSQYVIEQVLPPVLKSNEVLGDVVEEMQRIRQQHQEERQERRGEWIEAETRPRARKKV